MFTREINRKVVFYIVFSAFIVWIIVEPNILLSNRDGMLIILFVFLIQSVIDKRYLLEKLSDKFLKQKVLLNNLFVHCPDLIYMKNSELRYIDCNPCMKELLGLNQSDDITGKNDFDLFPASIALTIRNYDKQVIKQGKAVSYKFEKKLENGETKVYDAFVAPTMSDGNVSGVLGVLRDITQTELLKEKTMIQNAQLNSVLDHIPFLVYLKDLDGNIVVANKKVSDFVNLPLDSIVGTNPSGSYSVDFAEKIKQEDSEIINNKNILINEFVSDRFTKDKKWFRCMKSPILNKENEVIGILVLVRNIDEEKRLQSQKETFVASLTHDLKTPTIAQMNAMRILLSGSMGELNSEQKEMVQMTLDSNIYMSDLLSTILETYKSESGERQLDYTQFSFLDLVTSVCSELSNLSMAKNQRLLIKSDIEKVLVEADKLQIKRAVVNLITNAITYGYNDSNIEIFVEERDNFIVFDVKNNSPHIPPEKLKIIFEKYKSKGNERFNKTSTGLGLYLSKKIINDHLGEIHATSSEDETAIFGFSIPKHPTNIKVEQ